MGWRNGRRRISVRCAGIDPAAGAGNDSRREEDELAEEVTSQARFVGYLALALMAFALIVAAVIAYAGMHVPPA